MVWIESSFFDGRVKGIDALDFRLHFQTRQKLLVLRQSTSKVEHNPGDSLRLSYLQTLHGEARLRENFIQRIEDFGRVLSLDFIAQRKVLQSKSGFNVAEHIERNEDHHGRKGSEQIVSGSGGDADGSDYPNRGGCSEPRNSAF